MQGRSDPPAGVLDVDSVAGHLLPQGGVFGFLARTGISDALFTDLFPSGRGRPSVPAPVVATVLVLQALHGLSDREAAEAATFDLRWKAACGLPIGAPALHPTTLTYWRARLARSQRPNRVFEAVQELVSATGAVRGKTRRALDSTVLDDAVATQDTVTQLVAAVRRVARTVPGGAQMVAAAATRSGHDYRRPGKPEIAWDDPGAREQLIDALVRDALAVLAAVAAAEETGELVVEGAAADAVGLLALVTGQDVELLPDPDNPDGSRDTWRVAARRTGPGDLHRRPRRAARAQDNVPPAGRVEAHVVVEPDTGIVTACAVTKASGAGSGDAATGIPLLAADTTVPAGEPVEVLGDSAYGTGEMLAALTAAGHVPLVEPWPVNPAVPGGFTIDDFTVDDANGALTCPAGVTRAINQVRQVNFGVACRGCPLRPRCTRSATGKSMRVRDHDALQRTHRGSRRQPRVPRGLPPAPAHGRTLDSPDHPRQPQTALPRHRQEQRVAPATSRRDQPTPADRPRPAARSRELGPGQVGKARASSPTQDSPSTRSRNPTARCIPLPTEDTHPQSEPKEQPPLLPRTVPLETPLFSGPPSPGLSLAFSRADGWA